MAFNSRWSRLAAFCAALALAVALAPAADAQLAKPKRKAAAQEPVPGQQYSPEFRKQASKVQPLVNDKKWFEVLAALPALEALPDKTPDDERAIATWRLQASQGSGDKDLFAAAVENFLAKGYADASQLSAMHQSLAAYYNNKQEREKALHHYQQFVDATPDVEPDELETLGKLYRQSKRFPEAATWFTKAIDLASSKGEKPKEELFQLRDHCLVETKDRDGRIANLEGLIALYPKKDYYTNLVALLASASQEDRVVMLNAYRLAVTDPQGGLATVGGYLGYADLALVAGSPGEAARALQHGMNDKVVPGVGTNQQMLQEAKAAVASDQKTLAAEAAAAARSPKGDVSVKVGLGNYSAGNFEKAAELVRQGIAKGGVTRLDDANLLLGASLMELGRSEEAKAAFEAAAGAAKDPNMARLARLWMARAARETAAPAGG
ncbi:MAG: tetratricopeptide repeat protein [Steroidobacteraceae bacterium]|nr:tetratricopeptide repeat protein [Steroidobacteraceae bacterium]